MITFPLHTVFGPYHVFSSRYPITLADFDLVKHWLWDTLEISWNDVTLYRNEVPITVPASFAVPLTKRWQMRSMFVKGNPLLVSACLDQAGYRFHLPLRLPNTYEEDEIDWGSQAKPVFRHIVSSLPSGSAPAN